MSAPCPETGWLDADVGDNRDVGLVRRGATDSALRLAPLWKRILASVINVVAVFCALFAAVSFLAGPLLVLGEYDEEALDRVRGRVDGWRKKRSDRPKRPSPGVGIGLALAIERRNRRNYGQRVMRIRRVDAANGGPVTPTSAVVHYVVSELIRAAMPHESTLAEKQRKERFRAVVPELVALWKKPSRTHTSAVRESLVLVRKNKANPFAPIIRDVGFKLALHLLAVAVFPRRQSLPDFAAGIVSTSSDQ